VRKPVVVMIAGVALCGATLTPAVASGTAADLAAPDPAMADVAAATAASLTAVGRAEAAAVTAPSTGSGAPGGTTKSATAASAPAGPNPYLALLPDPATADFAAWRRHAAAKGDERSAAQAAQRLAAAVPAPVLVDEDEPQDLFGGNDRPSTAQPVPAFGTRPGATSRARILGTLAADPVRVVRIPPNREDDGAIPLSRPTGIGAGGGGIITSGVIGDGPHGSRGTGTGDFDFYQVRAAAGQGLTVDVDLPQGALDSLVAVYDAAGQLLAFNDDESLGSRTSLLTFRVPVAGTYHVLVGGFPTFLADPTDPASGTGAGTEGPYTLGITVGRLDQDFYAVQLRKGDVLGASVQGSARRLAIYDPLPRREDVHGSSQDATFIYPPTSPLPGGGNAVTDHVADQDGWHFVAVEFGAGDYDVTVEAYRPPLEGGGPAVQTLFLDFDGARVNTNVFGGPGVRELSPLRAFLGRWGLGNDDLDPLITGIVAEVRENVRADLLARGGNPRFAVRVLNSRDHADPWGQPNVSRVIVGGSIAQSGIPTIGIAQSIDPGNFETEESALVLLDLLSDPAGESYSLNTYLRPRSDRVAFVAQAVGNVTAHEAGHYFGNWHVDQFNDRPNLMDQGGNFPVLYGVGPDGVGGTADDPDVDFGEDVLNPNEGITGIEDTLSRVAAGLTS
jgi:hypothetical protein